MKKGWFVDLQFLYHELIHLHSFFIFTYLLSSHIPFIPYSFHSFHNHSIHSIFFYYPGILSDAFVLDYHWNEFKKSDLSFERKTDVKNSDTGIGMMFSGPALKPWATFLHSFMIENKDAESRLLTKAIESMKEKVNVFK